MQQINLAAHTESPRLSPAPTFSILLNRSLSLDQLSNLSLSGHSVIRSAHAGNLQANNLVILQRGHTVLLHEYLPLDNSTYLPYCKLNNGERVELAKPSGKIALWESCLGDEERGRSFVSPIHVHINDLQRCWPNARDLSSFVLSIGAENLTTILNRFFEADLHVAHALIDQNGCKHTRKVAVDTLEFGEGETISFSDAKRMLLNVFSMTSDCLQNFVNPQPTILPDTAAIIVLITIADLINPNKIYQTSPESVANVYHLAGVQMINYLINNSASSNYFAQRMDRLYQEARVVIPSLPEKVLFNLVPTVHLSAFTREPGSDGLNQILNLALKYKMLSECLSSETGKLLKNYQLQIAQIATFDDLKNALVSLSTKLLDVQSFDKSDFSQDQFIKNPVRVKNKIVGVIAKNLRSSEIDRISEDQKVIVAEMRRLKDKGALNPRVLSQYDLMLTGNEKNIKLIPELVSSLSPDELTSLMGVISKA